MAESNNPTATNPIDEETARIRTRIEGLDGIVVVCIGHTQCGKTSVVQSLIAYLNDYAAGSVDIDSSNSVMLEFFNNARSSFVLFEAPVTATGDPFFVKFKFVPHRENKHQPLTMSFIDIRGEAYKTFINTDGGAAKPIFLDPHIKAALLSTRQIVWLFVGSYENKPINNYKARESNVLSSFLAQFKENRTLPAMAQDRIIFLVSKTDQLAAIADADDHAQSVYKGVINAFQMRHGDIFKSISYSTGTWNDQGIPTSLNEKNAHRLANYLYQLR